MHRAVLVALLVALGCTAVLASPPCAPTKFHTGLTITVSGVYGAFEVAHMSIDFDLNAASINISTGVTGSNEPFTGRYLYVNGSAYWIQQGQCFPSDIGYPPVRCLAPNGNYSTNSIGSVNVTSYTIIGTTNTSAYTFTTEEQIPVMYQEFDWSESNAPANSTGYVYLNPVLSADPADFVVPSYCNAMSKGKLLADSHRGRMIKKLLGHH